MESCADSLPTPPMKISIEQVSKRYIRDWVFKNVNATFSGAQIFAILGSNGSGKSTLLRLISGMQTISRGTVNYEFKNEKITTDNVYNFMSFCAPGMDLVEEMTLEEMLNFHFKFKKIRAGWTVEKIIEEMEMQNAAQKQIGDYSSGMKQRAKLAQAFFSDTPFLLLDEPCSNLDLRGVAMYQKWLKELSHDRLVIIASNDEREYLGAIQTIEIANFK